MPAYYTSEKAKRNVLRTAFLFSVRFQLAKYAFSPMLKFVHAASLRIKIFLTSPNFELIFSFCVN